MTKSFTTTLPITVLEYLQKESESKKINRNTIITNAIKLYRKDQLKREAKKYFKTASKEYEEIANAMLHLIPEELYKSK